MPRRREKVEKRRTSAMIGVVLQEAQVAQIDAARAILATRTGFRVPRTALVEWALTRALAELGVDLYPTEGEQ